MTKKSDENITSFEEVPRAIDVVSVPALLSSQRLSVPDAALVAAIFRRLRGRSEGEVESPIEESTVTTSDEPMSARVRHGERFKQPQELMRATQESALSEWNSDGGRPKWRRDGAMIRVVHPGPAELDRLHYLSDQARASLRPWAERDWRYHEAEREAIALMQELNHWIKRGRTTLAKLLADDAGGGQALFALHRLLNPPEEGGGPFQRLSLAQEASLFVGWRVRRSDQTRGMIVYETERLMAQNGRKATARELALVSILCGQFPEGLKLGGKGRTAAEAIEAEQRIMREAQRRLRTALHKGQNPAR